MTRESRPNRLWGVLVVFCGLAFGVTGLTHLPSEPLTGILFGVVPPLVLSLAIVLFGVSLFAERIPTDHAPRIVLWMAFGILAAAGMALFLVEYETAHGTTVVHAPHVVMNSMSGGAAGGLLVGYYDSRRRRWLAQHRTTGRILDTIRRVNQRVIRASSRSALFEAVCEEFAASESYAFAWVGTVDDASGAVQPVASAGVDRSYLDEIEIAVTDDDLSRGPTANALETGEVQTVQNIRTDTRFEPWRADALEHGFRSSAAVPIQTEGTQYGVLNLYAGRTNAFEGRERAVLGELGDAMAHALYRLEVERRQQEYYQKLERENERLERFASIVSHDLRNPLNVAEMHASIIDETEDLSHLSDIEAAHERMERIIDDTLTLARDGRIVDETEALHLASVVADCWDTVETGDARLENEADVTIRADRQRVRHLLENLLRNAVEHSDGRVTVRIGTLADGFFVADDGPGIPADDRDRVFETGYTTADDGTGFGLSIVAEIATAHGWDVRVTDGDAGGARFEITGVDVVS